MEESDDDVALHQNQIQEKKKQKNGQMRKCCHSVHTRVLFFFQSRSETLLCGSSLLFLRKRGCATGSEAGGGRNTQEVK